MRKTAFSTAAAEVGRRDRVMANLIKRTSPFHLPRPSRGHFAALAESILHQQLAGAAARAIHGRFVALFDGDLSPEAEAARGRGRAVPALPNGGGVVLLAGRSRAA